jgi:hypothetical protein
MNSLTPNRLLTPSMRWLAPAAAVVTVISLQLVWVGALVCAVNCAKHGCAATVAGAARLPASHCRHSGTIPEAPAQDSGGSTHSRHCPAANLHNGSAATRAIAAPQMLLVAASSLATALPRAATPMVSPAAGTSRWQEISPQFIVPGFSSILLRI